MMSRGPSTLKRGKLTPDEKSEIERLASELKKPTPGKIALQLNRHASTVGWYMLTHGLLERPVRYLPKPYLRKGQLIQPWTAKHDQRISQLRIDGCSLRAIAEIVTREFGIVRTGHGVQVRLAIIAGAREAAA